MLRVAIEHSNLQKLCCNISHAKIKCEVHRSGSIYSLDIKGVQNAVCCLFCPNLSFQVRLNFRRKEIMLPAKRMIPKIERNTHELEFVVVLTKASILF